MTSLGRTVKLSRTVVRSACLPAQRTATCTQERILNIFRITGLTKVFGIYQTVDQAITGQEVSNSRRFAV
jgi:hypothetical protein